jgi:hypothetical protein
MEILLMRKNGFRKFMSNMGLWVSKGVMVYTDHGYLWWAPSWVKRSICFIWNRINCTINGHSDLGEALFKSHQAYGAPHCTDCGAKVKVDGRYPTPDEIEENDCLVDSVFISIGEELASKEMTEEDKEEK